MVTLNVKAEQLASVLLIEEQLADFQDIWRHRSNLVLDISFKEYLKFLKMDTNICKYFNISTQSVIQDFERTNLLSSIYPLFVQDVLLAQINEIFRAEAKQLCATTITYSLSRPYIKRVHSNKIEPKLREKGMYAVQRKFLSKGKSCLQDVSYKNSTRLQYCYLCYGYALEMQSIQTPLAWILI